MNISEKGLQELSLLMNKTSDDIMDEYYCKGSEILGILGTLGLLSEFESGCPVPLEVWTGIAQALADAWGIGSSFKRRFWSQLTIVQT